MPQPSQPHVFVENAYDESHQDRATLRSTRAVECNRSRGVTWLHVVEGEWLLTATSDSSVSDLSLWNVDSVLAGAEGPERAPTATAYLPGPVHQGLVDVQNGHVVIALEVLSHVPFTEIVYLAKRNDDIVFERLATLPGVARIRCLSGDLLGYSVDHEISIPSIVNWRTKRTTCFRDTPNVTGGCMAMAVQDDLVANLNPRRIDVYVKAPSGSQDSHSYQLHTQVALEQNMLYPSLAFLANSDTDAPSLCTLRLIFTADSGVLVSDISVSRESGKYELHEIWSHPADERALRHEPFFGRGADTICWYDLPKACPWTHVTLAVTTVRSTSSAESEPTPEGEASLTIGILDGSGPGMPALHLAPVCSYDEDSKILAVGNACGELSLYSSSADTPFEMSPQPPRILLPAQGSTDILSKIPLRSLVVPPYPHSILASRIMPPSFTAPGTPLCEELLAMWKPKQNFDGPIPEHWTADFLDTEFDDLLWWNYLPTLGATSIAWEMEHTAHYYGTTFLLLYNERDRAAVFKMGGLLFLSLEDSDLVFVARPGVTAIELACACNDQHLEEVVIRQVCDTQMYSPEIFRFYILGEWEKHKFGCNRWAELHARGGEVAPEFLSEELSVSVVRVQ